MNNNKQKTEIIKTPSVNKTEKLNIFDSPINTHPSSFTGSLKSGEVIKGYEVKSLISSSTGEAEIFLAYKEGIKTIIKYYHANFKPKDDILMKFHNLDHPDIITLYEYGYHKGRFYEIMEYAEGGTLADKKPDGTFKYLPMSEANVKKIIDETINAFLFIHKEGIIHRDIKPGNLFYKNAKGSDLLIGDFGISSELDVDGGMSKRMTSTLALSEGYAAPELYGIAKDDNKAKILIGPEVDYYALGITVYELLTAINPFSARNALHIMRDTIEGRVADDLLTRPEAKKISPQFKKLIRGLITVRHDKRWGYDEVSRWLKGEAVDLFIEKNIMNIPHFKFGETIIKSLNELANLLLNDINLSKKYLYRGIITGWLSQFNQDLAMKVGDIQDKYSSSEEEQAYGVYYLFYLMNGEEISFNLDQILSIKSTEDIGLSLKQFPEKWLPQLRNKLSRFNAWCDANSLYELKSLINELSEVTESDNLFLNTLIYYLNKRDISSLVNTFNGISTINDLSDIQDEKNKNEILQELRDVESLGSIWFKDYAGEEKFSVWHSKDIAQSYSNLIKVIKGEFEKVTITKGHMSKQIYCIKK